MTVGLERRYGYGHYHFVTFSCYCRQPHLAEAHAREVFGRSLERVRRFGRDIRRSPCVVRFSRRCGMIRRKDGTVLTHAETDLDLSEQDLREADFRGVYIEGGDLSDSDLRGVDFSGAHLYWTYFYRANCSGCNFTGALLQGVVLDEVDLSGANFDGAQLLLDNMGGGCSLRGTDLRTTNLAKTVLTGCKYDSTTLFPVGFDPAARDMIRVN